MQDGDSRADPTDSRQEGRWGSGFAQSARLRARDDSLGERLLGSLLDRAHLLPPRLVGSLAAQEIAAVGGWDVSIYLQDYDQVNLQPLRGQRLVGEPVPIDDSLAGAAFASGTRVEQTQPDGSVRLHLPMLDGSDRIGVLTFTLRTVDDQDRRLAQRLAGLLADMIVTKGAYTDAFARVRMSQPMTLSAQLQRQLLPPLVMTTPAVTVAGMLEPAYQVGGDSFDYALNEPVLHLAIFDALGHGLEAASMATVAVGAYRHARRADTALSRLYPMVDQAVAALFPGRFVTAQFAELDTDTGVLAWANAGHPAGWLIRGHRVEAELSAATTWPVGLGGAEPSVQSVRLRPSDRILFYTDGVVEERLASGEQFGETRFRALVEQLMAAELPAAELARRLSHALKDARGGRNSDDASLVLIQWHGPSTNDELAGEVP